jgi:lipid A 3-O-deacylase
MRLFLFVLLLAAAAPANAAELFTGLLAHDVHLPLDKGGEENGADVELGWRGLRLHALGFLGAPAPYVFGSLAIGGKTHFAAAGLSWRLGHGPLYARPGLGLAIHTRPSDGVNAAGLRTDLGSRVVFEPELAIGYQISDRVGVEGVLVHLSHAQLFSHQNPGMDSIGLRLTFQLP